MVERQNALAERHEEIMWDDRLKAKARLKRGIKPEKKGKLRMLRNGIMILVTLMYMVIIPLYRMP